MIYLPPFFVAEKFSAFIFGAYFSLGFYFPVLACLVWRPASIAIALAVWVGGQIVLCLMPLHLKQSQYNRR